MPPRSRRSQTPPPPPPPRFNPFTFEQIQPKGSTPARTDADWAQIAAGQLARTTETTPQERRAALGIPEPTSGFTGTYTTLPDLSTSPRQLGMEEERARRDALMDAAVARELEREDRLGAAFARELERTER